MPRRLLREPHVLAHELRTPLSVLAGWHSLVRDGDISPTSTPEQWRSAMRACQEAVDRLNFIITQACDEVFDQRTGTPAYDELERLVEQSTRAIDHSRRVLARIRRLPQVPLPIPRDGARAGRDSASAPVVRTVVTSRRS